MFVAAIAAALAFAPQQQVDTTIAVRSGGRLRLDNRTGSIAVTTWDREEMRLRARTGNRTRIRLDRSGSTVDAEADGRRGPAGTTDWEITVPRRFDVEIDAFNSNIEITGLQGSVQAETTNGSVTLSGIRGDIDAESTQGRITVRDSQGDLHAETTNESIAISGHEGEVHAETVNGEIRLSAIRSASVNAETVNGNVQYDGEIRNGGRYSLGTHNGGILLFVPANTNADVTVETYRGEIDSDFPIQIRGGGAITQQELEFTIGNGGARIELSSFGGNVRLRRPPAGRMP